MFTSPFMASNDIVIGRDIWQDILAIIAKRHDSLNASRQCEYRQTIKYVSTERLISNLFLQRRFGKILNQIWNFSAYWIPTQVNQCIIEQKIFWIQKILLEEFVQIYQIQRIWNKYACSTSRRNLCNALSCFWSVESSHQTKLPNLIIN